MEQGLPACMRVGSGWVRNGTRPACVHEGRMWGGEECKGWRGRHMAGHTLEQGLHACMYMGW